MGLIIIGAAIVCLMMWVISVRRRLTKMEENVSRAMGQIGVLLSSRFDAVTALLEETRRYAASESQIIMDTVKSRQSVLTDKSTPEDVKGQEDVISSVLKGINAMAEKHPEIKADETYISAMKAVDSYGKTAGTGRLIYNDSVTKLNRELLMFPTSLLGGMLGFHKREYLEAEPKPIK